MKAMKKILLAVLLLCVGLLLLTACEEESAATTVMYTVTYDTGGGSPVEPMTVAEGATLLRPADPTRESYIFDGWYKDAACTEPVDPTWVDAQQKLTPQAPQQ